MIDSDDEEMSDQTSYYSYSSDSSEASEEKKPRKYRSCYVAKKVKVNPNLIIFVINGHTGKDSQKPVTDIGEFLCYLVNWYLMKQSLTIA